jgi:predicted XRE-type DNA-binding protein
VYENWLPVPEYEGLYEVSDQGRVRNVKTQCLKIPQTLRGGRVQIGLWKNSKRKDFTISSLVAASFIGPRPEGMIVLHGPKGRNYHGVDNLSYGTYKQNNGVDRLRDGTDNTGERNPRAKLNKMQVRVIRRLLESKSMKQKEIGEIFGVTSDAISKINRGLSWQM